ncbi:MAG: hypothetical protein BIFFINMI_00492 [Phycisphaerae bacterium]|nr:hypothetical protein [Phycisphaerae bacterium]
MARNAATRLTVAAVQAPAGQITGPVADLDRLADLTAQAAGQGARLVAWPECAYPAYFLRSRQDYRDMAGHRLGFDALMQRLSEVAGSNAIYLVAGVIEEMGHGRLANAAILLGPDGRELARYRKHLLWHFDRRYFEQGDEVPVVQTEIGCIGLMICADGRVPELAAAAARQGAQLLVNPTAWVSWGREADELSNPQISYFLPARAMETGCWILSANKVGIEADAIVYCGRSNLVSPRGECVASLGPQEPGLLLAEVDLSIAGAPAAGELPAILFDATESLPITERRKQTPPGEQPLIVAAIAGTRKEWSESRLDRLAAGLGAQGVNQLIVPPSLADGEDRWARWMRRVADCGIMLGFTGGLAYALQHGEFRLAGGPVEGFAAARAAMLGGADLFVADAAADGNCPDLRLLRTRASENRIYVVAAAADRAVIVAPTGTVLADSLAGEAMAVVARLTPAAARDKELVPGTDVVNNRDPAMYERYLGCPSARSNVKSKLNLKPSPTR